jgi:hypothetical protein
MCVVVCSREPPLGGATPARFALSSQDEPQSLAKSVLAHTRQAPADSELVALHAAWQWSASRFPLARVAILQEAGGCLRAPASQLLLLGWPFCSPGGHVRGAAGQLPTGSLLHGSDQPASIACGAPAATALAYSLLRSRLTWVISGCVFIQAAAVSF